MGSLNSWKRFVKVDNQLQLVCSSLREFLYTPLIWLYPRNLSIPTQTFDQESRISRLLQLGIQRVMYKGRLKMADGSITKGDC